MPKLTRTFGVAAIAGLALSAGVAGSAQASDYGHHDDKDVRVEVRVEQRIDDDRAEFEFRERIEHGDVRFEIRIDERIDVDDHHGDHNVELRFEERLELRVR